MKAGSHGVLACALLLWTVAAAAQQPPPRIAPLPPAPAALTVPNPFSGMQPGPRDLYQSPDRSDRFQHLSPHPVPPGTVIPGAYYPGHYYPGSYYLHYPGTYYMPYSGSYSMPYGAPEHHVAARRLHAPTGRLALETFPVFTQVYVDGFYVGLNQEFGLRGRALELSAGAHRVELRAPGYASLDFSVMIAANETLRYRGDLQSLNAALPTRVAALPRAPQKSFFVIPNCYAGDKPPSGELPTGCSVKNLKTRR